MMKKIFLFLILLTLPLVLAAGGGGGGGGGGSSGTSAYSDLQCTDSGELSFSRTAKLDTVIVKAADGTEITVPGEWSNGKFTSEEAVLVKAGTYTINDPTYGLKTVTCPGLKFSCKLAQINLQQCVISEDTVTATFTLQDAKTENVKLEFVQGAKTLMYSEGSFSSELKGLTITPLQSNQYQARVVVSGISKVQISLPQCIGRYYKYSTIDCTTGEKKEEISGSTLKCGGYLDIHDRVKCRLSLREEQRQEYENFFPEECKARQDQQACLQTYQAVQECWDFPNGEARINCVKRVLKLGEILTEKANCNALDAGKRTNCNTELKEKVYSLVKFRLYNLEEEAEELLEEGLLSKEQVTAFVVKMETHKLEFNTATTAAERKQIIVQARQDWLTLMKQVRA